MSDPINCSVEVVIQHARDAVTEAQGDDGWVMIKAEMLSLLLDGIERLRQQIAQSCDDARSDPEHGGCPIVLQVQHERDCAVEDLVRLQNAYAARMAMIAEPVEAPASHHCETCQCPEIEAATDSVSTRPCEPTNKGE